jgi:integrase
MASDHLVKRGNQWYFRMPIPRPCRHLFISRKQGLPMVRIVEPLSDSPSVAKVMAAERTAMCLRIFAQIKAGLLTTPQQVKDALEPSEPDVANKPGFDEAMRRFLAAGPTRGMIERQAARFEAYGRSGEHYRGGPFEQPAPQPTGETVSQAADAWLKELVRAAASRQGTVDGHRQRVRAFVTKCGDKQLTEVTRAMASDFLRGLDVANGTRKAYATSLKCVFEDARNRGRFDGSNPFDDMKVKKGGTSYSPFTVAELQTLFDALPRDPKPAKHTPDTALPWVALIALYTGARLEEIAQLKTGDVREETANGARVWCIDVHNGGDNKLKNETSARLIPVHSELVRLGLLRYVKALRAGPLFPGLVRRESKGGKIGARLGELFRKKLVALKLKREGLCFHSTRHNVATALRVAGVPQEDAARVLGHAVAGISYGTYAQAGPHLKRVAAVVEEIRYDGLRL